MRNNTESVLPILTYCWTEYGQRCTIYSQINWVGHKVQIHLLSSHSLHFTHWKFNWNTMVESWGRNKSDWNGSSFKFFSPSFQTLVMIYNYWTWIGLNWKEGWKKIENEMLKWEVNKCGKNSEDSDKTTLIHLMVLNNSISI